MLPVAVAPIRSDQNAMSCTSEFADDVTFSHDARNRAESKTTRRPMFRSVHRAAALEAKYVVSDFIFFSLSKRVTTDVCVR